MEPDGITRACPMAPLMSRNTSPTQNQAMISRRTFCSTVSFSGSTFSRLAFSCFTSAFSTFTFHRYGRRFAQLADPRALPHLKLHEVGRIVSCVTRRTKVPFGVVHRFPQTGQ